MNENQKLLDEIKRLRESETIKNDPSLVFFIVRDWDITEKSELRGLCFAAQQSHVTTAEANWILDLLETALTETP